MRYAALLSAFSASLAAACTSSTAPFEKLPIAISAQSMGSGADSTTSVRVTAGLRSLLISGGHRLTYGIRDASGHAMRQHDVLNIRLDFRPLESCPFAPTPSRYEAIVSDVRPGWYEIEVRQSYWSEEAGVVLRQRVFVPGG